MFCDSVSCSESFLAAGEQYHQQILGFRGSAGTIKNNKATKISHLEPWLFLVDHTVLFNDTSALLALKRRSDAASNEQQQPEKNKLAIGLSMQETKTTKTGPRTHYELLRKEISEKNAE